MITVFHNSQFMSANVSLLTNPGTIPKIDFKALTQVAIVNTDDLGEAFLMVQHQQQPWHDNPDIQVIQNSRSTSVGDVMQTKDGNYWLVGSDDFLSLGKPWKNEINGSENFQLYSPQKTDTTRIKLS